MFLHLIGFAFMGLDAYSAQHSRQSMGGKLSKTRITSLPGIYSLAEKTDVCGCLVPDDKGFDLVGIQSSLCGAVGVLLMPSRCNKVIGELFKWKLPSLT